MSDGPVKQIEQRKNLNSLLIPSDVFEGYRPGRHHWSGGVSGLKDQGFSAVTPTQAIVDKKKAFKAERKQSQEQQVQTAAELDKRQMEEKALIERNKNMKIGGLMHQKQQLEGEVAYWQQRIGSDDKAAAKMHQAQQKLGGVLGDLQKSR